MENMTAGRAGFETLGNLYPAAGEVKIEKSAIAGVSCAWLTPAKAKEEDIIIYIHGGAFIYGSLHSHTAMVSHIAAQLKRKILMIDYRLAPEYPFPNGLEDCVAVIKAFNLEFPSRKYGLMGDSAGGNLTIAAQVMLNTFNEPLPQYSIVISPWVDLECKNASYISNKTKEEILKREYLLEAALMYAGTHTVYDSLLSPVNADLRGLPPALILCGTAEILQDDSYYLHQQFLKCDEEAELVFFENEQHVWPFMDIGSTASQEALSAIEIFANKHSRIPTL